MGGGGVLICRTREEEGCLGPFRLAGGMAALLPLLLPLLLMLWASLIMGMSGYRMTIPPLRAKRCAWSWTHA